MVPNAPQDEPPAKPPRQILKPLKTTPGEQRPLCTGAAFTLCCNPDTFKQFNKLNEGARDAFVGAILEEITRDALIRDLSAGPEIGIGGIGGVGGIGGIPKPTPTPNQQEILQAGIDALKNYPQYQSVQKACIVSQPASKEALHLPAAPLAGHVSVCSPSMEPLVQRLAALGRRKRSAGALGISPEGL